ncbi:MAG: type II secretion system protein GspC [Woeseiaceae bacterium]
MNQALTAGLSQISSHPVARWLGSRGPAIAMVLLAIIIAWMLAGIIWSFFPDRESAALPGAGSVQRSAAGPVAKNTSIQPIVDAHIFGIASEIAEEDTGPVILDEEVTVTNQPLVLRGTLAANSEGDALAIIAEGREENVYKLEDTIRRGVTLHAVQKTQVILNVNGKLEALQLPEQESRQVASPARRASRNRAVATTPSVSQVLTNNASSFAQIISPRPYYVGGQQRGYRVYPGKDRRQFQKLGLRPGDIITEVNGTALTNPTQGAQIFSSLGDAQSVSVTLERNGSPQTLTLDVNQLDVSKQTN